MIEYIYFVKCPNCEDEHFYFFNDAKDCAMGRLSQKPIITQTEVSRNDFGECTDSCDLGTVWSWEDMMKDVPADPEQTVFNKADTVYYTSGSAPEFDALDNSLDPTAYRKPVPANMSIDDLVEAMEENEDDVECKFCHELFDKSECEYDRDYGWLCSGCQRAISEHGGQLVLSDEPLTEASKYKDSVEFHYDSLTVDIITKVIPATLEDPADYEEDEYTDEYDFEVDTATIEEVLWNEFITEEDVTDVPGGLDALEDEAAWKAFLDTHFEELLEKYNDQLLEYFREDAEEAAREEFQERYNDGADDWYYENLDKTSNSISEGISASAWNSQSVELEYMNLPVSLQGPKRAADDWDDVDTFVNYTYEVDADSVAEVLWNDLMTEEDVANIPGGFDKLYDDEAAYNAYMEANFDNLVEKYIEQLLKHFEDDAAEEYASTHSLGESCATSESKTFLEEFDDAETHKANLNDCPECGSVSYDMKEQYCSNCGFGL